MFRATASAAAASSPFKRRPPAPPVRATLRRRVHPSWLILENIRSAANVGHVVRTAAVEGFAGVGLVGISSDPHTRKVLRTSLGAEQCVATARADSVAELLGQLRRRTPRLLVAAVETTPQSVDLWDYCASAVAAHAEEEEGGGDGGSGGVAFVLGCETQGVSAEALALCTHHVHLPLRGFKSSLNVADCAAVVAAQVHAAHRTHRGLAARVVEEVAGDAAVEGVGSGGGCGGAGAAAPVVVLPPLREYPRELSTRPMNKFSDSFTAWVEGRLACRRRVLASSS